MVKNGVDGGSWFAGPNNIQEFNYNNGNDESDGKAVVFSWQSDSASFPSRFNFAVNLNVLREVQLNAVYQPG
jgi:hypothetical protein